MEHRMYEAVEHVPVKFMESYTRTMVTSEITADADKNLCVAVSDEKWWIDVLFELADDGIITTTEILDIADYADLHESFANMEYQPDEM